LNLSPFRNLLFDLGGVIVHLDISRTHRAFSALAGRDPEIITREFREIDLFKRYEKGLINDESFRHQLQAFLRTDAGDDQLDEARNAMLLDIPPARVKLLKQLRGKYILFLLSNTNAIHVRQVNQILRQTSSITSLEDLFDRTFYSHQVGMSKPAPEVFRYVLDHARIQAEETLFLDDSPDYLRSAQQTGIPSVLIEPTHTILDLFADAPTED
jgi:putative hydrolase of the HAD superfamily